MDVWEAPLHTSRKDCGLPKVLVSTLVDQGQGASPLGLPYHNSGRQLYALIVAPEQLCMSSNNYMYVPARLSLTNVRAGRGRAYGQISIGTFFAVEDSYVKNAKNVFLKTLVLYSFVRNAVQH